WPHRSSSPTGATVASLPRHEPRTGDDPGCRAAMVRRRRRLRRSRDGRTLPRGCGEPGGLPPVSPGVHGGQGGRIPRRRYLPCRAPRVPHGRRRSRPEAVARGARARRDAPKITGALEVLLQLLPERLLRGHLAVVDQGADGLTELVERDRADDGFALRGLVAVDPVRDAL